MKIIHFSDTHLGYSDYGRFDSEAGINQRESDTYRSFREIMDYVVKVKPDLVIHAGDLFDSIRPSNRAIIEALKQLSRVSKEGIPTVIIAGNHSTPRQRSTDSIFGIMNYLPNIYPVFSGSYERIEIGTILIHAIPHMFSDEDLRLGLKQLKPDSKFKYNIMIAHAAVRGQSILSWGEFKEQTIPIEALKPEFDYIALGHYHDFHKVRDNAYYCSSPERFSFNEVKQRKGFVQVDLDNFSVKHIPTNSREMLVFDPIDCSNLSAAEVMRAFESLVSDQVKGKIVKAIFENISRPVHSSLDIQRIRDLVKDSVHYEPEYRWKNTSGVDQARTSSIGSLGEEFEIYLEKISLSKKEKQEMKVIGLHYLERILEVEHS